MQKSVILCFALLVAFAHSSPLGQDSKKDDSQSLKVVDVPAGIFDPIESEKDASHEIATAAKDEEKVETVTPIKVDSIKGDKVKDKVTIDDESPSVFGIRFPSIVIFRRPAVIRDPFASFQSPFFASRPSIFSSSPFDVNDSEIVKIDDQKPVASGSDIDTKVTSPSANRFNDMMTRMHQQINNLFSSIFNPDAQYLPRPTFPRPTFSRPSLFAPFSPPETDSVEDNVDFDKLPANYSNSTSETKIVDGQVVTVNKTIHKVSGNNSNGFFHFQVIKFGPSKSESETIGSSSTVAVKPPAPETEIVSSETSAATTIKNAETDPQMNEVDHPEGHKELSLPKMELETKYEIENEQDLDSQQQMTQDDIQIVPIPMSAKLIKAPGNGFQTKKISDLSSDIRVNNMIEEEVNSGKLRALYDPDEVEVFDV